MEIIHRKIDFKNDKDYILERHCRINYECDCPWKRKTPYDEYRAEWFSCSKQLSDFYTYFKESSEDKRTISEIIETPDGNIVGYLWVPFIKDTESGFSFADIQDIYIEEEYRNKGIAASLLRYSEEKAKSNGAKVIRSGTGCENIKSIALHKSLGFYQYRYEFEKLL